jgi:hypothetical protein
LAAWKADAPELERLRFDFEQKENQLKSAIDLAQAAAERAAKSLALARNAEQSLQRRIAAQSALVESLNEQLGGAQRDVLLKERNDAETRLADARRKLKESTLTEAEQALEAEFESVRADRARQAERLRQNENLLAELRGQLIGTEGLHQKRIQAEQTVNDRSRELDRESLYAGAHKHLKELFEHVRQEQVRRTVGPINDRVMQWAGLLDLNDYARLEFDGQLLPQGLALNHASTGDAVQLERESFGTLEQLSLLIRLAVGGLLARSEPTVAILDDPLAHADPGKHRKMLDILARAAQGEAHGPHPTGPLQLIVLTCHADRFDYLQGAQQIDLGRLIRRGG